MLPMLSPILMILLALLQGAPPTSMPSEPSTPITRSSYGLLFVNVTINHKPAVALVDTGSHAAMELSPTFAKSLRLKVAATGTATLGHDSADTNQSTKLDSVTVANVEFRDIDAIVPGDRVERVAKQ